MTISPAERVERIRVLNYVLPILMQRSVRARRAINTATNAIDFNAAIRQARIIDEQITKYRNELFDLTAV